MIYKINKKKDRHMIVDWQALQKISKVFSRAYPQSL